MSIDITAESITSTRPDSRKEEEEEEEEKLAVNRASCALDAVYAKVQKYLSSIVTGAPHRLPHLSWLSHLGSLTSHQSMHKLLEKNYPSASDHVSLYRTDDVTLVMSSLPARDDVGR